MGKRIDTKGLRSKLEHGTIIEVVRSTGLSRSFVDKVAAGERKSERVLRLLYETSNRLRDIKQKEERAYQETLSKFTQSLAKRQ